MSTQTSLPTADLGARHSSPDLFVRKSSGLVRSLSVRDTFAIGFSAVALMGAWVAFTEGMGIFQGADFTFPLIIAAAVWLLSSLVVWQLTTSMPNEGGDYVY